MPRNRLALAALGLVALCGAVAFALGQRAGPKPALGLVTSLPIFWSQADDPAALLQGAAEPHWARRALERGYRLVPLDTLAGPGTVEPGPQLAQLDHVLLAQPAALPPADLVALDTWVRGGGQALLFVDPALTEESRFALGDRRRPAPVAMLGPLLAHWGLAQDLPSPIEPAEVDFAHVAVPLDRAGRWRLTEAGAAAQCTFVAQGFVARCAIGKGQAMLVGDAAVLNEACPAARCARAFSALAQAAWSGP